MQMDGLSVRIDDQTKRALEAEAQRADRKPRALARVLIREGLERRGYLVNEHGDDRMIAGGQGQGVEHGH